ncbi:MAG: PAS domain-containing protein [Chloroflexi bacterium]|nr:PAS domain-containing protein [Chloroflexota bacterium]
MRRLPSLLNYVVLRTLLLAITGAALAAAFAIYALHFPPALLLAMALTCLAGAIALAFAYRSQWKALRKERDLAVRRSQEMETIFRATTAPPSPWKKVVGPSDMAPLRLDLPSYSHGALRPKARHPQGTSPALSIRVTSSAAQSAKADGQIVGAIGLASSSHLGRFNAEQVHLLTTLADNVASSLEQATLHEELQQALLAERRLLDTLREVTKRLAIETNLSQALEYIADSARGLVEAGYGTLLIWDSQNHITTQVFTGISPEERSRISGGPPQGQGLLGLMKEAHTTLRIRSISNHPRAVGFPPGHPPMSTLLGSPIALKNGYKGAMYFANKQDHQEFTAEDERIIGLYAALSGVLLDNVNLFQAVAQERSTLQAIQESILEGLVVLDSTGREIYRNRAMERLTGLLDTQVRGRPLVDILREHSDYFFEDPATLPALLDALAQCHTKGPIVVEGVIKNPHRRVLAATIFPIPVEGREAMSGLLLRDVTRERDLERRRDAFVSVASHELRTPLTTIVGFAELLLDRDPPAEKRVPWLQHILAEGNRLTAIIDDTLNISRIQSGRLAANIIPLPLAQAAASAVAVVQPTTQNHTLTLSIPQELPHVLADEEKLMQVLINLLSNAVKYSPKGGEVRVAAFSAPADQEVVLSVADQGIGISQEDQERLFTSFTRIRRPETEGIRGTGLGLYIVNGLVELMRGRIWVQSELNQGSTFFVAFPIAQATPPQP